MKNALFVAAVLATSIFAVVPAQAGERGCESGFHRTNVGCVGETITDRAMIKDFDESIKHGCVVGATRVIYKKGQLDDGHPIVWRLTQHTECKQD